MISVLWFTKKISCTKKIPIFADISLYILAVYWCTVFYNRDMCCSGRSWVSWWHFKLNIWDVLIWSNRLLKVLEKISLIDTCFLCSDFCSENITVESVFYTSIEFFFCLFLYGSDHLYCVKVLNDNFCLISIGLCVLGLFFSLIVVYFCFLRPRR